MVRIPLAARGRRNPPDLGHHPLTGMAGAVGKAELEPPSIKAALELAPGPYVLTLARILENPAPHLRPQRHPETGKGQRAVRVG